MKATCPTNPKHNRFATIAHMSEEWVVDEQGDFITKGDIGMEEVIAEPHPKNTWTCTACGAEATVVS
jgi:hypothetical protein